MNTKLAGWLRSARSAAKNGLPYAPLFLLPGGSLAVFAVWLAHRARADRAVRP